MADPTDTDLGDLKPTEASPRFNEMYARMTEWQFGLDALKRLDDADLDYLSGHRAYVYPAAEGMSSEQALGIQQKIRSNALRAKDELDRRLRAREMEALEQSNEAVRKSNEHMRTTAWWTRCVALATMAGVIVALFATFLVDYDSNGGTTNLATFDVHCYGGSDDRCHLKKINDVQSASRDTCGDADALRISWTTYDAVSHRIERRISRVVPCK